jgi:hypothetical protein
MREIEEAAADQVTPWPVNNEPGMLKNAIESANDYFDSRERRNSAAQFKPDFSVVPGNVRSLQLWPFFIMPDSSRPMNCCNREGN